LTRLLVIFLIFIYLSIKSPKLIIHAIQRGKKRQLFWIISLVDYRTILMINKLIFSSASLIRSYTNVKRYYWRTQQNNWLAIRKCQNPSQFSHSNLFVMQQLFDETSKLHDIFSQDLTNLIAEIAALKEKVKKNPLELKKFLVDKMHPLEDELMMGEENQKQ